MYIHIYIYIFVIPIVCVSVLAVPRLLAVRKFMYAGTYAHMYISCMHACISACTKLSVYRLSRYVDCKCLYIECTCISAYTKLHVYACISAHQASVMICLKTFECVCVCIHIYI